MADGIDPGWAETFEPAGNPKSSSPTSRILLRWVAWAVVIAGDLIFWFFVLFNATMDEGGCHTDFVSDFVSAPLWPLLIPPAAFVLVPLVAGVIRHQPERRIRPVVYFVLNALLFPWVALGVAALNYVVVRAIGEFCMFPPIRVALVVGGVATSIVALMCDRALADSTWLRRKTHSSWPNV